MPTDGMVDVVIVGGGHAGLLVGAMLARQQFQVRLVERTNLATVSAAAADGRSLALLAGSVRAAERYGIWPFLASCGAPVWRTEVRDISGGGRIAYDSPAVGGSFGYGFENIALRRALLDAFLAHAGPSCFIRGQVVGLATGSDRAALFLKGGARLEGRLVVAADGRRSAVRELAQIRIREWQYPQAAIALVVEHDRPHAHTVREWLRPPGPLALLPLPGQRSGVTWVDGIDRAEGYVAAGKDSLLATLRELTGNTLGTLRLAGGPSLYPLGALHAERYVAPRLALLGDAAHGVHPIHAQGFNMAVGDAAALVESLCAARSRGVDLGSGDALIPYARRRRPENDRRLLLTDTLNRVFSSEAPPLAQARGMALAAVDALPPLKRLVMRRGMQLD